MKNKYKGFTIVELVIVIAVIAVLAAVAIPTFSAIIKRTNISADTQAVRNMNIVLAAECAASPAPAHSTILKELLKANGITDLTPQTRFHTFFWIEDQNVIILADEGDTPVYPEEYLDMTRKSNWHALDAVSYVDLPNRPRPEGYDERESRIFTVTVTQSGSSVIIPFEGIPTQAREYSSFEVDIVLPADFQTDPKRYAIQKVTAIMHDGDDEYKIEVLSEEGLFNPFEPNETVHLSIPDVTGNIEINIDIVEFCYATVIGASDHLPHFPVPFRKGSSGGLQLKSLIDSGGVILSVKAYRNGEFLGELYDERYGMIRIGKELTTDDFEIRVELAPTDQTSETAPETTPEPTE